MHYAQRAQTLIAEDEYFDLIAGSAGYLLAVLGLAAHRPSDVLYDIARACGERLLTSATPQTHGVGWIMRVAGPQPLAGISHGAAGAILALLRLWSVTGDVRMRQTALDGLAFERSLYSSEHKNWPDLRAGAAEFSGLDNGEHYMCAWCHGAPGIGRARVAGLPYLDTPEVREDINRAVFTTLDKGFGTGHSLCHGDLGNLDFLLAAARTLGDETLHDRVYRIAGGILNSITDSGWLFGLPGNIENPGLMVGLAGVAYELARLAEPTRLPSPLALEPPIA